MQDVILTDEQVKVVTSALQPVPARDRSGNVVGVISPVWTEEEMAEAKRRLASNEPHYTTAEVLNHLRSLDMQGAS